jgi:hypothetical protein
MATRRSGRVVEGSGLENRRTGNRTVGSNPTSSARETEMKNFELRIKNEEVEFRNQFRSILNSSFEIRNS